MERRTGSKRILVYKLSDKCGGTEAFLLNYNREIRKHEDVYFDYLTEYTPETVAYYKDVRRMREHVIKIVDRHTHPIKNFFWIRNFLKKHPEYETVYFCAMSAPIVISVIGCIGLGRRIVVHSHSGGIAAITRHKLCRPLLNLIADKRLACSERAARFMFGDRAYEKGKVKIIPNAIDVDKYAFNKDARLRLRTENGLEGKLVFGFIGRFDFLKDPIRVLKFFEEVHTVHSDSVLVMIGEGELRNEIEAYIVEKQMESSVILKGLVSNANEWYSAFDALLLLSRSEGFPMVGIEAQCSGLPCIFSSAISKEIEVSDRCCFVDRSADLSEIFSWLNVKMERREDASIPEIYNIKYSWPELLFELKNDGNTKKAVP